MDILLNGRGTIIFLLIQILILTKFVKIKS